jgi:hypothetical protein
MTYSIQKHVDPYYPSIEGLELIVNDCVQAVIKTKGQKTDLVFAMKGPLDLELARPIIVGLLDLLVHYDKMAHKRGKS